MRKTVIFLLVCLLSISGCKKEDTNSLAYYKRTIVGKWSGMVKTAWIPPYPVDFEFFADGRYSARCTNGASPALYYGTDADSPIKTYSVNSTNEEGAAGELIILFDVGTTTIDEIRRIRFPSKDSLHFEMRHISVNSPLVFDLKRR